MNVDLEPDFITRTVMWVTRGGARRSLLRVTDYVDPVSWRWEDLDDGTGAVRDDLLPTLVLPEDVLKALVAAGADALPPDRAQAAHLADTIKVRDQLLGLVADAHPRRRGS